MADLKISQLTAATDVASSEFEIVQGGTNKRAANTLIYHPSGTDVALADGGTGASLTDPNADRIMFWDDSAGAVTWLTAGTGLSISGTTLTATGSGITSVVTQVFDTAGTSTYTPTSGMQYAQVIVVGGGGGSSYGSSSNLTSGSGGGGGGTAIALFDAATIGTSQSVTVGAAGVAGTNSVPAGGNGGTSSFGSLLSATGGSGGATSTNSSASGGTGTGGDYNIPGGKGGTKNTSNTLPTGGSGGGSSLAPGQPMVMVFASSTAVSIAGAAGNFPGGGASGGARDSGTSSNGSVNAAAGGVGAVIIMEYI